MNIRKITQYIFIVSISLGGLGYFAQSSLAGFEMANWPLSRSINTSGNSGMVKVQLPDDFSFATQSFNDLRIVDGIGNEVPFLVTRNMTSTAPTVSVQLLNLSTQSDGSTVFIADTGNSGTVRNSLNIQSSSQNFRRQVSVYAADSLLPVSDSRWSLITSSGYIFKFTDPYTNYTSGKNSIDFSSNASRYFKVVISSGPEGAVAVTSASVQGSVSVSSANYSKVLPITVFNNPAKKATEVIVDLGATGILSHAITVNPTDTNYNRRVIVETSSVLSTTTAWSYVGQGSISRVS
nr:hypothetical protein [bacterium]